MLYLMFFQRIRDGNPMKIIFYLLPCVMNIIMGLFFFITMRRLAISGADSFAISGTMAVWAFIYAVVSALLGVVQHRGNATKFILAGEGILIFSMLGFLVFPSMRMQYVWLFGSGIGTAMFFAPFQVIVKMLDSHENARGTLAKTAAVYTFSWSFGFASGPFIAAMIWGLLSPEDGWKTCYKINILLVLAVTCFVWFLHCFIRGKNREDMPAGQTPEPETAPVKQEETEKLPDLAVLGWIVAGTGFITIAMLRTQIPYRCNLLGMSTAQQGIILAAVSYMQAFLALGLWKSRRWMYHPFPVAFAGLCGVSALLLFVFADSYPVYVFAGLLYGCYSGVFCFFFVYHALANPEKSHRYVAVNEVIVGSTSVFAPLASGALADAAGNSAVPFFTGAVLIVMAIVYQVAATWRWRRL